MKDSFEYKLERSKEQNMHQQGNHNFNIRFLHCFCLVKLQNIIVILALVFYDAVFLY